MKRMIRMYWVMYRYNGCFMLSLILFFIYLLLAFAMGFNAYHDYTGSGIGSFELLNHNVGLLKAVVPVSILLIIPFFYILPLINIKDGKYTGRDSEMLLLSLPISRRELAASRVSYTAASSILLVLLITAAVAAGIHCGGGIQWEDSWVIVRSWLFFTAAAIHISAVSSVALYLTKKHFLIPVSAVLFLICSVIRLVPAETVYGIISLKYFWPVFAAGIISLDLFLGTAAVFFEKKDI